ncbi:alpha/beta hydrolase [Amycolatopsis rifamycinica]|uniref:Hydrolase n=1 Tax=Amycolatopsis rifamycinica TaxID=287986 RepID=A0A066UEH6_9PSEU|nr:alpha/beta hydrolase [Amycolatopsis rifamycinica]KDN24267.1 hydrolase [Amycolatopsis rifamycinica]
MLGTVLASALLLTGAAPAVTDAGWAPSPIVWTTCPDDPDSPTPPNGECGTVRVPLDWDRPGGPSIDLAVARHRATDTAHRFGVLLADLGGPGSASTEFALAPGVFFSPEVQARFDVVGFDVRGTGRSEFIDCPDAGRPPSDEPTDRAGFAALRKYSEKAVSGCRARNLPVFDHANTAVNARDMDAVRRALGEARISFLGISYGTLLGQQYAEQHGDRVRAMVLDSSIDHSASLERFLDDRATAADEGFRQFAAWCDRTATCALHGQDVFAVWEKALAVTGGTPAREELRDRVLKDMYRPDWADIGQAIADAAAGVPPMTAQFSYNYTSIRLAVVCQDFDLRIRSFAQYSALHAEELRHGPLMRGSTLAHGEAMACLGVHGPPANPPHPLNISRAPRILLLNSRFDPATPYAWALAIHRQAPANTTLLTYEGAGHGVYERNACTRSATDRYLLTLEAPKHDLDCPA